jgi:hypothetical protein
MREVVEAASKGQTIKMISQRTGSGKRARNTAVSRFTAEEPAEERAKPIGVREGKASVQSRKQEDMSMPKFMSSHTVPAGTLGREQVDQLGEAARNDPTIRPYRSFLNLSEGKIVCVMEAPDPESLAAWFQKMQMPCDSITPVELEGERGVVKEA